jgi:uncharacterized membrane protein YqjE
MPGLVFAAGVLLGLILAPTVFFIVVFWREYRLNAEARRGIKKFESLNGALGDGRAHD